MNESLSNSKSLLQDSRWARTNTRQNCTARSRAKVHSVHRSTRSDKARRLGFKNKLGFVIYHDTASLCVAEAEKGRSPKAVLTANLRLPVPWPNWNPSGTCNPSLRSVSVVGSKDSVSWTLIGLAKIRLSSTSRSSWLIRRDVKINWKIVNSLRLWTLKAKN